MATKKTSIVIALAAVVVVGVALIAYFANNRPPTPSEQVTGAIGAAERYHAEQISDEDVILDIPGEVEVTEAVLAVLDDEQVADLLDSLDDTALAAVWRKNDFRREQWESMPVLEKAHYARELNREALQQVLHQSTMSEAKFNAMSPELQAKCWNYLSLEARGRVLSNINFDRNVFKNMSDRQLAAFGKLLAAADLNHLLASKNLNEAAFKSMSEVDQARVLKSMEWAALQAACVRAKENLRSEHATAQLSSEQVAAVWRAMDLDARQRAFAHLDLAAKTLAKASDIQLNAAWRNLSSAAREAVTNRFSGGEKLEQMSERSSGAEVMRNFVNSRGAARAERATSRTDSARETRE